MRAAGVGDWAENVTGGRVSVWVEDIEICHGRRWSRSDAAVLAARMGALCLWLRIGVEQTRQIIGEAMVVKVGMP